MKGGKEIRGTKKEGSDSTQRGWHLNFVLFRASDNEERKEGPPDAMDGIAFLTNRYHRPFKIKKRRGEGERGEHRS